ncbi:tRNA (adenosine(37)-N6)-threonylcarbamoyltransferase complex transferase subunit TsaD [bacterium]|nr:tRNA (adenosine(37)-N6)-threonylcarbamoyltransferase complex transferase subunit TsaD [bacterium]
MLVLGIETSCDETSAAVFNDGTLISNIVYSQSEHRRYGGVVPELASRAHIRRIVPVVDEAISEAGVSLSDIELIGATVGPGLVGSLLVGLTFAKTLCFALDIPFVGVNHIEAHIFSSLVYEDVSTPALALVVSGGHTELHFIPEFGVYRLLGKTRDDAAGECLDKTSKFLGLGYPGGPVVDRIAKEGDPDRFSFPRAMLESGDLDFSFSGIKTSVIEFFTSCGEDFVRSNLPDILAGIQEAVVDSLVEKLKQAYKIYPVSDIIVVGGVAANSRLREKLARFSEAEGVRMHIPPVSLCTDNAAMVARLAIFLFERNGSSPLSLSAVPRLDLAQKGD